jgi:hypothetical protein
VQARLPAYGRGMFILTALRGEVEYRRQQRALRRELIAEHKANRRLNPDYDAAARMLEASLRRGGRFSRSKAHR